MNATTLERGMLADLADAYRNVVDTLRALGTRGARLEALAVDAHALAAESEPFARASLGVLDRRVVAHYCRLCCFDIDFRRAAFMALCVVVAFVTLVVFHWSVSIGAA